MSIEMIEILHKQTFNSISILITQHTSRCTHINRRFKTSAQNRYVFK